MRYVDWVEKVLRVVVSHPGGPTMFGFPQIAELTGLGKWDDPNDRSRDHALGDAVDDLKAMNLLAEADTYSVASTYDARRYRTHPLSELYPREREGHLEPDEEAYLAKLAELSEVEHDAWAEVRRLRSTEIFDAMGWPWDRTLSLRITNSLETFRFADVSRTNDMDTVRLAFAGAVRIRDEPTMTLAEACEYLSLGRPRAAGCIAGVELERRLKVMATVRSIVLTTEPGISAYNDALKGRGYDKAMWRKIQHLGDLRNLSAHVLDHEPTLAEARELVDGVEEVLRALL